MVPYSVTCDLLEEAKKPQWHSTSSIRLNAERGRERERERERKREREIERERESYKDE